MKRILVLILSLAVLCCTLASCKSDAEKELGRAIQAAEQAGEAANRAQEEYEDLKNRLEELDRKTKGLFP